MLDANQYILNNKLIKIHPTQKVLTNGDIENVLKKFFPKAYLYSSGTNVLWYRISGSWFDKDIKILQDGNLRYINITGLGRGESTSPFHGLANYRRCKQIAQYLNDKQI